jgi:uncharacterized membrane protein YhhN
MTRDAISAPVLARIPSLFAFLPFGLVTIVHLTSKITLSQGWDVATKPLLMPTLAIAFVLLGRHLGRMTQVLMLAGILLSWVGDVTLSNLTVGLSFFLLAHLFYIAVFLTAFDRRMSRWGLLAVPWFVALLWGLENDLGGYFVPVVLYGLVLGFMAVAATRGTLLTVLGGVLFVASDSLLAFRMFTEALQDPVSDLIIMLLYLAAQALLALGVLQSGRRRAPRATPH